METLPDLELHDKDKLCVPRRRLNQPSRARTIQWATARRQPASMVAEEAQWPRTTCRSTTTTTCRGRRGEVGMSQLAAKKRKAPPRSQPRKKKGRRYFPRNCVADSSQGRVGRCGRRQDGNPFASRCSSFGQPLCCKFAFINHFGAAKKRHGLPRRGHDQRRVFAWQGADTALTGTEADSPGAGWTITRTTSSCSSSSCATPPARSWPSSSSRLMESTYGRGWVDPLPEAAPGDETEEELALRREQLADIAESTSRAARMPRRATSMAYRGGRRTTLVRRRLCCARPARRRRRRARAAGLKDAGRRGTEAGVSRRLSAV